MEPEEQEKNRGALAQALRELRLAAGLSGERLAARCAMSQSKISRIETGKILPTVLDVERILSALGAHDAVTEELLDMARVANVDYTSDQVYARIGFSQKQSDLESLEASSSVMRHFLPAVPTGLLQTPDYARAALSHVTGAASLGDISAILRARTRRQKQLDQPGKRFLFLLTEQALRWRLAAADVMSGQLEHMAEVAEKPSVEIAVVPASVEVRSMPLNVFVVYDERVVTVELFSGEVVLRDPRDVSYHLNIFQFFLDHALTGSDATEFLRSVAEEFS